ncbi:hypothetical protein HpHA66_05920 [Helicobacter pylori]
MKNTFKAFAFLIVFFSSTLLAQEAQDLKIAAAANLTRALKALVKEFQKEHPKDAIRISFNSSGKLYAQIIQNAPFDLFISADIARPKKIYDEKITPFKEEVYAKGVLVLWSENLKIDSLEKFLKILKSSVSLWLILN